jgi:hypothetical protein
LRCFFFAIRLRRFLMTEPMGHHPLGTTADAPTAIREAGAHARNWDT